MNTFRKLTAHPVTVLTVLAFALIVMTLGFCARAEAAPKTLKARCKADPMTDVNTCRYGDPRPMIPFQLHSRTAPGEAPQFYLVVVSVDPTAQHAARTLSYRIPGEAAETLRPAVSSAPRVFCMQGCQWLTLSEYAVPRELVQRWAAASGPVITDNGNGGGWAGDATDKITPKEAAEWLAVLTAAGQ